MHHHIFTLVLATGTLVPADATRPSAQSSRNDHSVSLSRHRLGAASTSNDLDRRTWVSRIPKIRNRKRSRHYRHTTRDDSDSSDEDGESSDDEEDDKHSKNSGSKPSDNSPSKDDDDEEDGRTTTTRPRPTTTSGSGSKGSATTTVTITASVSRSPTSKSTKTGETSTATGVRQSAISPSETSNAQNPQRGDDDNERDRDGNGDSDDRDGDKNGEKDGDEDKDNDKDNDKDDDDDDDKDGNRKSDDVDLRKAAIATGTIGGLILLLTLFLVYYFFRIRPKQREERQRDQDMALAKAGGDMESQVSLNARNMPREPERTYSGNDVLATNVMSAAVVGAAGRSGQLPARNQDQDQGYGRDYDQQQQVAAPVELYAASNRASSPTMPNADTYATAPYQTYNQDNNNNTRPYSPTPMRDREGSIPIAFPLPPQPSQQPQPQGRRPSPSLLHIDSFDGRSPPPRYPDIMGLSTGHPQIPLGLSSSPTSPLSVSPLSPTSPGLDPHAHRNSALTVVDGHQYRPQQVLPPSQYQYQEFRVAKQAGPGAGPGDYYRDPPSQTQTQAQPATISPMYQMGHVSATLPEYDESAEEAALAVAGASNGLMSQRQVQGRDEKDEVMSPREPMHRY
ncbi:hypothetical protein F4808DRAFT_175032 [Astrocystis sublimbata]|nr:hypothetical protein F4808DRAFT_175032 [Astrocystis sublimbata]